MRNMGMFYNFSRYTTIGRKIRSVYYYIRNKFFRKYYLLDIKAMPRHEWCDSDYQMFHAMFQILVNYVEGELGRDGTMSRSEMKHYKKELQENKYVPTIYQDYMRDWWWEKWRGRKQYATAFGLAHLDWAANLDNSTDPANDEITLQTCGGPDGQAASARVIRTLYMWYKFERLKRLDPYDVYDMPKSFKLNNESEEERKLSLDWALNIDALEKQYDDEDTSRMQQLIVVRHHMWT